jgi:hypothetical protein
VSTRRPLARSDELVIEELEDEVLIYDKKNKRAHCLSATAARVWRACDGVSDAEALAETLDLSERDVRDAFDELESVELFEAGLELVVVNGNGNGNGHGLTRRELTKRSAKVGAAVAAAPMILSITAPTAWATATPPQFFCEIFTTQSCGASSGCGSIAGCCCCNKSCPAQASCKGCTSISACASGSQPCATSSSTSGTNCSDAKGTNPFTVCGCCGPPFYPNISSAASGCGCGWGTLAPVNATGVSTSGLAAGSTTNPGAGCCDMSSTGPTPATGFVACGANGDTTGSHCVPCCNGIPIYPGSHFGCCGGYFASSPSVDACVHTKPTGYPTSCS